ncbi:LysR family transcriptional regulator [Mesorhizobium sp. SP-1A]|uniref:LysR family transcriptional regulator n=1 Tax=Mesorhizobium sp. SP-1A TaxID=3077840 RepID=UPI0028F74A70|nr:LysR family transcriptional regulator [Mesorhizobium sp. SP-1A]
MNSNLAQSLVSDPNPRTFSMRFTLRQLAYFVAAGEVGGVTLASERINVSQPSISAAISQLEVEFGLQLFVRHHAQGLSLTPAGQRVMQAAKALLQQAEELHGIADEVARSVSGPLNVGFFRTLAPMLIPELCKTFLELHPAVRLQVYEDDEATLIARLRRAEINLALTYSVHLTDDIAFEPLAELPTHIVLAASDPLASARSLPLAALAEKPFILLDMPLSKEYFLSLFMTQGLAPNIVAKSEYPETVRSFVASGFGYSLMTARPANRVALNGKELVYVRLEGSYSPMMLGIATLKGLRKTCATESFEEHCRAQVSTENLPGMASWR